LSGADEIVFGEVSYREPRRLRRPDRDPSRACLVCGVVGPDDLPIFLELRPADAIERHALRDTEVELGGILLGYEAVDDATGEPFVWITEAIEAKHYENSQASFTYTHDSWAEITREREQKHPELDIVGWYHTHPDFGVFLSGHDLFIHHHFFAQPLQVAYVVDPIRQTRGFFRWRAGQMEPVGGFFVTSERRGRVALARFVNELEQLPNPEGAGGGFLSPRLEAELIAMLNRPHGPTVVAAPSGAASGAAFTLLGVVLGVLGMAAVLWLNHLTKAVREQTDSLKALQTTIAQRTREAATAETAAKEAALNALLAEVRVGASPQKFLDLYQAAIQQRDEARKRAETLATEKEALNLLTTQLRNQRETIEAKLAAAQRKAADLEQLATDQAKHAAHEIRDLEDQLKRQTRLVEETKAGTLARKYALAWYTAAGALAACLMLLLSFVWVWARGVPPPAPDETSTVHKIP
jgi:proteasome lid subunit RPN8/RPN11